MKELYHCYGNKIIYNRITCFEDCCHFYYACRIRCGDNVNMFEYKLVDLLIDTIPKKELLEILQINYDISYNAARQAVKRYKKKRQNEEN